MRGGGQRCTARTASTVTGRLIRWRSDADLAMRTLIGGRVDCHVEGGRPLSQVVREPKGGNGDWPPPFWILRPAGETRRMVRCPGLPPPLSPSPPCSLAAFSAPALLPPLPPSRPPPPPLSLGARLLVCPTGLKRPDRIRIPHARRPVPWHGRRATDARVRRGGTLRAHMRDTNPS